MRPFVDFPPIIGSPVEGDILAYVLEQDPQHRPCEDSLPPLVAIVLGDTYKPPSRRKEEDTKACLLINWRRSPTTGREQPDPDNERDWLGHVWQVVTFGDISIEPQIVAHVSTTVRISALRDFRAASGPVYKRLRADTLSHLNSDLENWRLAHNWSFKMVDGKSQWFCKGEAELRDSDDKSSDESDEFWTDAEKSAVRGFENMMSIRVTDLRIRDLVFKYDKPNIPWPFSETEMMDIKSTIRLVEEDITSREDGRKGSRHENDAIEFLEEENKSLLNRIRKEIRNYKKFHGVRHGKFLTAGPDLDFLRSISTIMQKKLPGQKSAKDKDPDSRSSQEAQLVVGERSKDSNKPNGALARKSPPTDEDERTTPTPAAKSGETADAQLAATDEDQSIPSRPAPKSCKTTNGEQGQAVADGEQAVQAVADLERAVADGKLPRRQSEETEERLRAKTAALTGDLQSCPGPTTESDVTLGASLMRD